MVKLFWVISLLLLNSVGLAHEDLEHREIQETSVLNAWLPFNVTDDGKVSFFKTTGSELFIFSPVIQIGAAYSKARYSLPERVEEFALEEDKTFSEWLEVHQRKYQAGLGLGVLMKNVVKLGLVPFKGASQKIVRIADRYTKSKLPLSLLPKSLKQMESWRVGDIGTYQTYGGIELHASVGLGIIDIGSSAITIQNEFTIELKRVSIEGVSMALYEGKVNKRKLSFGTQVANLSMSNIKGRKLGAAFILNLKDNKHHELYELALAGRISELQKSLPYASQKLTFKGAIEAKYVGIPVLIGKNKRHGQFQFDADNKETTLYFSSRKNDGVFLPKRDVHRFVYFTDSRIILFWSSEMKKAKGNGLDKYFVSVGRAMGMKGFQQKIPKEQDYGTVLTQLGLTLRYDEISALKRISDAELDENYAARCEELRLNCRKEGRRLKVLRKLRNLFSAKWEKSREELGKLLIKNPALIHSLLRALRKEKSGYFFLLSSKFKSKEGMAAIEL